MARERPVSLYGTLTRDATLGGLAFAIPPLFLLFWVPLHAPATSLAVIFFSFLLCPTDYVSLRRQGPALLIGLGLHNVEKPVARDQ
eukprot:2193504-Prymnesium_polylepis.1